MKAVLDSLDGVPEVLKGEYEARNGQFFLKVDEPVKLGLVSQADLAESNRRLAEFRDNNRALNASKTELEAQLKHFEGIDPVKAKEAADKIRELEARGVRGGDDVAKQIADAVKAAVSPLESTLSAMKTSEAQARADLARKGLETELQAAGTKLGVDPKAMPDYIERGLKVWTLVDGKPVARKGDTPIFSKSHPADPISMDEWATQLQTEASHLFTPSRGGGASNGTGAGERKSSKVISSDPMEFGKNLEGIAKGEVTVEQ